MGQLLGPAFSKLQGDHLHTNMILRKFSTIIFLLGGPLLPFFYFCGGSLLTLVYGRAYSLQAGALSIAAGVSFVNILNAGITGIFFANGRPELHRRGVAVMALTMLVLIYPLARWLGPLGGQVSCLIAVISGFALQSERIRHVTGFQSREYGEMALGAIAPTMIVAITCLVYKLLGNTTSISTLGVGLVACFTAYGFAAWRLTVSSFGLTRRATADQLPGPQALVE
jgi:O-antigen/teichoic acid export membrane protein